MTQRQRKTMKIATYALRFAIVFCDGSVPYGIVPSRLHIVRRVFFSWRISHWNPVMIRHGPLTRYVKLTVAHAPGMPGTFFPPPWVSYPDMHHGTCVTHVTWWMPGSLTSSFLWSQWRGKTSPAFIDDCEWPLCLTGRCHVLWLNRSP